jgi:L-ascorbate metabolism protein UlaG (beta-lactamase superfamily)
MEITKFAQSCFLIKTQEKKILIDPGVLKFDENLIENEWNNIDIILITHKHADHCDEQIIKKLIEKNNSKIFSTQEVANAFPKIKFEIIEEGQILNFENFKVEVVKAVHGWMPVLKGGKEILENVGFIIEDGEKRIYHTSDTICFDNNFECDVLLVPVCNHGLVMGPFEAAVFSKEINAKIVIPMHYDNPVYPIDLEIVKKEFEKQKINYFILDFGKSIKI